MPGKCKGGESGFTGIIYQAVLCQRDKVASFKIVPAGGGCVVVPPRKAAGFGLGPFGAVLPSKLIESKSRRVCTALRGGHGFGKKE